MFLNSGCESAIFNAYWDVFSISGRGTVVTGRVESGVVNDEIEIIGIKDTTNVCTGVEMFRKLLIEERQVIT